jgi:hypothetical protein
MDTLRLLGRTLPRYANLSLWADALEANPWQHLRSSPGTLRRLVLDRA